MKNTRFGGFRDFGTEEKRFWDYIREKHLVHKKSAKCAGARTMRVLGLDGTAPPAEQKGSFTGKAAQHQCPSTPSSCGSPGSLSGSDHSCFIFSHLSSFIPISSRKRRGGHNSGWRYIQKSTPPSFLLFKY